MQVALFLGVGFKLILILQRLGRVKQISKRSVDVGFEGLVCLTSVSIPHCDAPKDTVSNSQFPVYCEHCFSGNL